MFNGQLFRGTGFDSANFSPLTPLAKNRDTFSIICIIYFTKLPENKSRVENNLHYTMCSVLVIRLKNKRDR